jgi:hypothetical protein
VPCRLLTVAKTAIGAFRPACRKSLRLAERQAPNLVPQCSTEACTDPNRSIYSEGLAAGSGRAAKSHPKRGWQVIKRAAGETIRSRTPAPGNARRAPIANFDTFREETTYRINGSMDQWINGSMARMSRDWQNNSVPDPVQDQQPADDCVVPEVLEQTQLDNWRKQLTLIRGEVLEIAEQGSQQGLVDLQQETVRLAEAIELLEVFLVRKAPH